MQKIISCCLALLLFVGCTSSSKNKKAILIVTSNQHTYGTTNLNAANHFGEIVLAYDVFIKSGYQVDFVSPEGGAIPIGYVKTNDSIQKKYLYNTGFMNKLKHTLSSKEVNAENYNAVYYSGGGAAMFGVSENKEIQRITRQIYNKNGVVAAICHGTAGLAHLKDVYKGKKLTGFPDAFENKNASYYQTFPFSIQEKIITNGGDFSYSKKGWDNFYITDGRLVTGQDPSATASVAKKVIELIQHK